MKVGDPLPSEARLCSELGVSRGRPDMVTFTIQNAEAGARVGFARLEAA